VAGPAITPRTANHQLRPHYTLSPWCCVHNLLKAALLHERARADQAALPLVEEDHAGGALDRPRDAIPSRHEASQIREKTLERPFIDAAKVAGSAFRAKMLSTWKSGQYPKVQFPSQLRNGMDKLAARADDKCTVRTKHSRLRA
jgi:hypothetical protein